MEPLIQLPAIKVEVSSKLKSGSYVVPQPKYLLDRTSTGIFYLLADKEQQLAAASGQTKKNPFRVYFGEVYRTYVRTQLCQAKSNTILIDLDEDFDNKNGGKLPDFAVIQGNICVIIEVKTSLLTLKSRAFFEESQMEVEIRTGSFKKAVTQLHDFRSRILLKKTGDHRFAPISEVISILAGYEDIFVLNSYLLPMLEVQYGPMTKNLQLACISDIDAIGSLLSEGKPLGELLKKKVGNTEERKWMLDQYLRHHIQQENPVLKQAFDSLLTRFGVDGLE
ncbi:hypothetical protein ACJVDH_02600 [Pedobacter sp. AW1-32]|uniref:hypothetical protein n=1 Tax=Pedobacter sp. AW1-32 TaxID=3383026 RepID=UPI003FEF85DB